MTPFDLLRLILAVWWIAYAVTSTGGPGGIFERVRNWRKGQWHGRITWNELAFDTDREGNKKVAHTIGDIRFHGLLDCIICLAPWVALILILLNVEIVLNVFAVAGGAVLLHGYTGWRNNY